MTELELDPRWEWHEIHSMDGTEPIYRKGNCNHLEIEPVVSGGETVAQLCLTCDAQLPPPVDYLPIEDDA